VKRVGIIVVFASLAVLITATTADAYHHGHKRHRHHKKHTHKTGLGKLLAPASACPGQSDVSLSAARQEAAMRCMINYARRKSGHADLADTPKLDTSAGDKANDIIRCDQFSHSACGRDFTFWFDQLGYIDPGGNGCWRAGENIAWGTGSLSTVGSIADAWIHSPEHLANMLSASFEQFGVGFEVGPLDGFDGAHVWVTHFGSHC
jgi:uncharacterized protein YkwD